MADEQKMIRVEVYSDDSSGRRILRRYDLPAECVRILVEPDRNGRVVWGFNANDEKIFQGELVSTIDGTVFG